MCLGIQKQHTYTYIHVYTISTHFDFLSMQALSFLTMSVCFDNKPSCSDLNSTLYDIGYLVSVTSYFNTWLCNSKTSCVFFDCLASSLICSNSSYKVYSGHSIYYRLMEQFHKCISYVQRVLPTLTCNRPTLASLDLRADSINPKIKNN